MTHENDFTVNVLYEEHDIIVHGVCEWSVENDSFDYAGTHCTGGQSGTHELPDYCQAESCEIQSIEDEDGNDFPVEDSSKLASINHLVLEELQRIENESGSEMQSIISSADDAKIDAYLDKERYYE